MNQNAQQQLNDIPILARRIVSNLTAYLWCAEICYYLYIAFFIFLAVSVRDANAAVYVIFAINFILAAMAILGCQLCRRNLTSNPMNIIGGAKTWYSVMLGVSCLLTVFYVGYSILLFSSEDIYGIGFVFGMLFLIIGVPLLLVTLIGFYFYSTFSRIIGASAPGINWEEGYQY